MDDNGLKLTFETQEMLADDMTELFKLKGQLGWLFFREVPIKEVNLDELPAISLEKGEKSPSERLRGIMYVWWNKEKTNTPFDIWYRQKMEQFIENIKSKLD